MNGVVKFKRKALSRLPWRTLSEGTAGGGWQVGGREEPKFYIGQSNEQHVYHIELDLEAAKELKLDLEEFLEHAEASSPQQGEGKHW